MENLLFKPTSIEKFDEKYVDLFLEQIHLILIIMMFSI